MLKHILSPTGQLIHKHSPILDCVLLAASRNHPTYLTSRASPRQIRVVHDDLGHFQVLMYHIVRSNPNDEKR